MYLKYFQEQAYDDLFKEISSNTEHYKSTDTEWLDEYFKDIPYYGTSSLTVSNVNLDCEKKLLNEEKNQQDLTNVRLLYDAYKILTPLQATDKLLWAYLAHTTFKEYVVSRWIKNSETEDEKIQDTIANRFFISGTKGLMRMNAISRLWWAGYLTYDENNSNHYHLTNILFTGQQICADILDTPFCGNKKIIKGILHGLKYFIDESQSTPGLADHMRECVKYFRRYAAVTNVDFLDENEIKNLIFGFLIKK